MKQFLIRFGWVYLINIAVCFYMEKSPATILKAGLEGSANPTGKLKIIFLIGMMGMLSSFVIMIFHCLCVFLGTWDIKKSFASSPIVPAIIFVFVLGTGVFSKNFYLPLLPVTAYICYLYAADIYQRGWKSALGSIPSAFLIWFPFPLTYILSIFVATKISLTIMKLLRS